MLSNRVVTHEVRDPFVLLKTKLEISGENRGFEGLLEILILEIEIRFLVNIVNGQLITSNVYCFFWGDFVTSGRD